MTAIPQITHAIDGLPLNDLEAAKYLSLVGYNVPPGAKLLGFMVNETKITIDFKFAGTIRPNTVTIDNTVDVRA